MTKTDRIRVAGAALLMLLVALGVVLIGLYTSPVHREFTPGTGVHLPAGPGIRLPLDEKPQPFRVDWPDGLGLIGNTGAWNTGGSR